MSNPTRTFGSCYRFSAIRRFLIRWVLVPLGVIPMVLMPYLAWRLYTSLRVQIPTEAADQLRFLMWSICGLSVLIAFPLFFLRLYLARLIFDTEIQVNDDGLTFSTGPKKITSEWSEVVSVRPRAFGRIQTATVKTRNGTFRFDASFQELTDPPPHPRTTWRGETVELADGNLVEFKIKSNPLFLLISQRLERS